ncbi:gluconate 5-dehydrogenase [Yersinia enterocolitica]|nr:gluconate 5-dehydrogenase [Yersinia enterocolitica]NGN38682.1 gluconate 5-dehydrogenase [Yersinia enterocolitica subsp. palearctica]EKN5025342.1 gluconate 5-dehydrogenase [Yersinia enterocolitica]EKN5037848.1 gluconate 5-dehydrogenase [Yersinia enterocolitica]EKN5047068.1 gluconate 5-dehydrogenase [Yersinia enterocolitica]
MDVLTASLRSVASLRSRHFVNGLFCNLSAMADVL